jgi:outer membrane protein assembly factor BamB
MGTTVVLGPEPGTVAALAADPYAGRVVTMSYPPRITGTAARDGQVDLLASPSGSVLQRMSLPNPITLAASPALGIAVVGFVEDNRGQVIALRTSDAHIVWTARLPSMPKGLGIWERGARVAVALANNAVLALEAQTGHPVCQWGLSAQPTALALDGTTRTVVVGTADGHLVAQSLRCQ